ncbi:hypothetical protein L6164_009688 [Bauhinia variegata]|uniref:Uncharacterized protein n=1 Tax=Bauhinia variegata TaxID=167791 RepID=A0ACB9PR47_BAUVA|nr:hypothetical protein L6164_009688 [Bauhinia variegata]
MAYMWRKLGCSSGGGKKPPADVPPGHVAILVGETKRRHVIKANYLSHPLLQQLLDQVYEEYGFNKDGPLVIPCNELIFEDIIQTLRDRDSTSSLLFSCQVASKKLELSLYKDSEPLLQGFDDKKRSS